MNFSPEFIYTVAGVCVGWILAVGWDLYKKSIEMNMYREVIKDLFLGYMDHIRVLTKEVSLDLQEIFNNEFSAGLLEEIHNIDYLYLYLPRIVPIIKLRPIRELLIYFNSFSYNILSINYLINTRNDIFISAKNYSLDLFEALAEYDIAIVDLIKHIMESTGKRESIILKTLKIKGDDWKFYHETINEIKKTISSSQVPLKYEEFIEKFRKTHGLE